MQGYYTAYFNDDGPGPVQADHRLRAVKHDSLASLDRNFSPAPNEDADGVPYVRLERIRAQLERCSDERPMHQGDVIVYTFMGRSGLITTAYEYEGDPAIGGFSAMTLSQRRALSKATPLDSASRYELGSCDPPTKEN